MKITGTGIVIVLLIAILLIETMIIIYYFYKRKVIKKQMLNDEDSMKDKITDKEIYIKTDDSMERIILFFRQFWGKFVFYVIATGIIGLFLTSIIFEKKIGLNELNSWVGIVLGLVALIIGIISLFLSFYNVDQSTNSQKETIFIMRRVERDIEEKLVELEKSMEQSFKEMREEVIPGMSSRVDNVKEEKYKKENWTQNTEHMSEE